MLLIIFSLILLFASFKLFSHLSAIKSIMEEDVNEFKIDSSTPLTEHFRGRIKKDENVEYMHWDEPQGELNTGGPGEAGVGVKTSPEEHSKVEHSYGLYGFNQYVSDQISLHRSLSDPRPKQ